MGLKMEIKDVNAGATFYSFIIYPLALVLKFELQRFVLKQFTPDSKTPALLRAWDVVTMEYLYDKEESSVVMPAFPPIFGEGLTQLNL